MGVRVVARPLLVSGLLAQSGPDALILIDSEQHPLEQTIALLHEALHLLGLRDEVQVERIAVDLARCHPELAREVLEAQGSNECPRSTSP